MESEAVLVAAASGGSYLLGMGSALHERDVVAWSEQQGALLRRLALGKRVNGVDWGNVVEEIESVGRGELRAVESLLVMALVAALKIMGWPGHSAGDGWWQEVVNFLVQARGRFEPGMAQRLDAAAMFARARRAVAGMEMGGVPPLVLAGGEGISLEVLLDEAVGVEALVGMVAEA